MPETSLFMEFVAIVHCKCPLVLGQLEDGRVKILLDIDRRLNFEELSATGKTE